MVLTNFIYTGSTACQVSGINFSSYFLNLAGKGYSVCCGMTDLSKRHTFVDRAASFLSRKPKFTATEGQRESPEIKINDLLFAAKKNGLLF